MANNIKFVRGSIRFNKKDATVKIPLGLAKQLYEKSGGNCECFITVINGIAQISPKIPDLIIPMMKLECEYFLPQKH